MRKAWGVFLKILSSDAVTAVMGFALAYIYIKFTIKLIDYMTGAGS